MQMIDGFAYAFSCEHAENMIRMNETNHTINLAFHAWKLSHVITKQFKMGRHIKLHVHCIVNLKKLSTVDVELDWNKINKKPTSVETHDCYGVMMCARL